MNDLHSQASGHGSAGAEHASNCRPAPKWAVVVEDALFPMPRQKLVARDILDQAGRGKDLALVRDYETPHDVIFADDAEVDLAEGNVFRTVPRHDHCEGAASSAAAKLAFICDDAWEVTLISQQTEHSLKRLLGLPEHVKLYRDFESPNDERIAPNEQIKFADGPVFCTRAEEQPAPPREFRIIVNGREKVVAQEELSYAQVVSLAFGNVDANTICTITYKKGPSDHPEGSMVDGDVVKLKCGMIFNVTPTYKS